MFVILQKYDFSSKSQLNSPSSSTINDVCDTAKVRFFKQITTGTQIGLNKSQMFVILQKYDFSSKSQQFIKEFILLVRCLWYCKSTIFQANHNMQAYDQNGMPMFVILQKYDFSSKSQQYGPTTFRPHWCLWYCKSTIFQANHNYLLLFRP